MCFHALKKLLSVFDKADTYMLNPWFHGNNALPVPPLDLSLFLVIFLKLVKHSLVFGLQFRISIECLLYFVV